MKAKAEGCVVRRRLFRFRLW